MGRLLFWLLLGVVVYAVLKAWARPGGSRAAPGGPAERSEDMVRCQVCGLNTPKSEALAVGSAWYCSEEHRRIGAAR
ncbi:MAG TPA: PP0621 family protein [Burkholderiaceae bacterium]